MPSSKGKFFTQPSTVGIGTVFSLVCCIVTIIVTCLELSVNPEN